MCSDSLPAGMTFFEVSAGERTVPGVWHENYWLRRHEAVYRYVATLVRSTAVVLDAGCGEGYGTAMLAERSSQVLAVDYDAWTTQHLSGRYPQVSTVRGNLVALPLEDGAIDLVASLQSIEHLWDQDGFVRECARVLRPDGLVVVSTPNRHTFPPGNVFHHRELDAGELTALLTTSFDDVTVAGVHHGERLSRWQHRHGSLVDQQLTASPDDWPAELASAVRSVDADDFTISACTEGCLDLVALGRAP